MSSERRQILSFDVFDTVVARCVGDPAAVFLLLGRRLFQRRIIRLAPETFARARMRCEETARENAGTEEITLRAVYAEMAWRGIIAEAQIDMVALLECELEKALIQPAPRLVQQIADGRREGQRIIFVSDMYLPRTVIEEMLVGATAKLPGEPVYVSSEVGRLKRTGRLFGEVLRREGATAADVIHHGNDLLTDGEQARRHGIATRHIADGNLTVTERLVDRHLWETGGLSAALAGASRVTRLAMPALVGGAPVQREPYEFGAEVVAPILVSYLLWVIDTAERAGIRTLYFLSRDGELPFRIIDHLLRKTKRTLTARYLYASRKVWGLASVTAGDPSSLHWLARDPGNCFQHFFKRVGIAESDGLALLREFKSTAGWTTPYAPEDLALARSAEFQQRVIAAVAGRAAEQRRVVLQYLRQEGFFDAGAAAIVDIGWHGTLHSCLRHILQEGGHPLCPAFYFGAYEIPDEPCRARSHVYYGDNQLGRGQRLRKPEHYHLLEMMTTGREGTLVGLQARNDGTIAPVLAEPANQPALAWGLLSVQAAVEHFARIVCLDDELVDPAADCRAVVHAVLDHIWSRPTPPQARVIATYPFEGGMGDLAQRTLAATPYGWREALRAEWSGDNPQQWHAGRLAMSPDWIQRLTGAVASARRRVRRLKQL